MKKRHEQEYKQKQKSCFINKKKNFSIDITKRIDNHEQYNSKNQNNQSINSIQNIKSTTQMNINKNTNNKNKNMKNNQKQNKNKQNNYNNYNTLRPVINHHINFNYPKIILPYKIQLTLNTKIKKHRISLYQQKIKQQFIPKISIEKQKQLINRIESEEINKNGEFYKRIKNKQSGEIVMEKIQKGTQRQKGMKYLQSIKQKVKQYKDKRRNNNFDDNNSQHTSFTHNPTQQQRPKPIDYLKQLRQRSKPHSSFFLPPQKTSFSVTKNTSLSFDQKLQKIQKLSTKLLQKTKQQQMMLKYGKFKTSEEILIKKQIIDQNYIELINLKLDMIEKNQQKSAKY